MTVAGIMVKGELQLGCDVPCSDDGQARSLMPMHHAVGEGQVEAWHQGTRGVRAVHMVRDQRKSTWRVT